MLQRLTLFLSLLPRFKIYPPETLFFFLPVVCSEQSFSPARCRITRTIAFRAWAPGCVWGLTQLSRRYISQWRTESIFVEIEQDMKYKRERNNKKKENPNARPKSESDSPPDALRGIVLVDRSRPFVARCATCCISCHGAPKILSFSP